MPRRILLIYDEVPGAMVARGILRDAGPGMFEVEWVRRCADGIARLAGGDVAYARRQTGHRGGGG